jgi:hypothetical protein
MKSKMGKLQLTKGNQLRNILLIALLGGTVLPKMNYVPILKIPAKKQSPHLLHVENLFWEVRETRGE